MKDSITLIKQFLQDQQAVEKTKRNYKNTLNKWAEWLIVNGISWGEVRKPHIIRFRNHLISKGRTDATINTYLSILKKFYAYLNDAGEYPDVCNGIKMMPKYKGFKKKPLTIDQVGDLIDSIKTDSSIGLRDRIIIELMIFCGLRCVEISRLNEGDFSNDLRTPNLKVTGKGQREKQKVRIPSPVSEIIWVLYLEEQKKDRESPLFKIEKKPFTGQRLSPERIGAIVKARLKNAGINDPEVSAHSLRHTNAILRRTVLHQDIREIQLGLRHTSPEMTLNYMRYIEDEERLSSQAPDQLFAFLHEYQYDQKRGQKSIKQQL